MEIGKLGYGNKIDELLDYDNYKFRILTSIGET